MAIMPDSFLGIRTLQDGHGAGDTLEFSWLHLSPAPSQWSVVGGPSRW
jgi:hypothetical protein